MNTRYKFTGKTSVAIVEYDPEGLLCILKFESGLHSARAWLASYVPIEKKEIEEFQNMYSDHVKVTEIPADLSFARFWEMYDYKIGKKQKVIELWQALSETDRIAALVAIPKYKQWLSTKPNMEMLYPQTFLSQRRWENTFRV